MTLVLFDIDGTLVLDDGATREAFAAALHDVFGFDGSLEKFDFSGRTDPQIAHEVLGAHGFESDAIAEGLPSLWFRYVEGLRARLRKERQRVLAGVTPLLERLAATPDVTLALLTGNIEPGARVKLAPWELNRFFPFGAFGSDSKERANLPPIAIERARRHTGRRLSGRSVVIIGDSIWDIRCGVPHGATTIAVASGRTPAADLRAENPDHLFESMEPTEEWMKAILG
ncbi:MAG TPA: HAD family hydrolase [Thermoanaerobaculia bacterium]|nr:HAD family hydrolase [Thermoanaerobaculia bacterium]